MTVYRIHSARLDVSTLSGEIVLMEFYGPFTAAAVRSMGEVSAPSVTGARALVFDLSRAVFLFSDLNALHNPSTGRHQRISGAMVGSVDQLPMLDSYSRGSASRGITRAVFLTGEMELALAWARGQSEAPPGCYAKPSISPLCKPDLPPCG